jgi:hypothetical protein
MPVTGPSARWRPARDVDPAQCPGTTQSDFNRPVSSFDPGRGLCACPGHGGSTSSSTYHTSTPGTRRYPSGGVEHGHTHTHTIQGFAPRRSARLRLEETFRKSLILQEFSVQRSQPGRQGCGTWRWWTPRHPGPSTKNKYEYMLVSGTQHSVLDTQSETAGHYSE